MKKQIFMIVTLGLTTVFTANAFSAEAGSPAVSQRIKSAVAETNAKVDSLFPVKRAADGDLVQYAVIGLEAWGYRRIATGRGVLTKIPGYHAVTEMMRNWARVDNVQGVDRFSSKLDHAAFAAKKAVFFPLALPGKIGFGVVNRADTILKYYIVAESLGRLYVWRVLDKDPEFLPGITLGIAGVDTGYKFSAEQIEKAIEFADQAIN